MKNFLRITTLLALAALPVAAATFTVHNTGGAVEGAVDPNWSLAGGTPYVTVDGQYPFVPWLANTGTSSWISGHPDYSSAVNNDAPGSYTFSTTFDLTGLDHTTASLGFVVAADDSLTAVLLNGQSQGISYVGLASFSTLFTINSDFVAGSNTLEFVVNNGGELASPVGLRVEFSGADADEIKVSDVPEPSSIALLGFGTVLLFSRRFRKAK